MPSSSRVAADARTSSVVSADRRSALAAADRYALHGSLPHGDPASASPTAAVATLAITGEPRSPPKPRTPSKPTPAAHASPPASPPVLAEHAPGEPGADAFAATVLRNATSGLAGAAAERTRRTVTPFSANPNPHPPRTWRGARGPPFVVPSAEPLERERQYEYRRAAEEGAARHARAEPDDLVAEPPRAPTTMPVSPWRRVKRYVPSPRELQTPFVVPSAGPMATLAQNVFSERAGGCGPSGWRTREPRPLWRPTSRQQKRAARKNVQFEPALF